MHPSEGRLCQCPERFFAYPLLHPSIVTDHETRKCKHISILVYFFLMLCYSFSLSFLLHSGAEQPNVGLNERNQESHRSCFSNFSKQIHFSSSFFFFFNSFEHLLLVISCFLLCTLLVDNSSMLGQQQKGDDAEKRISRGATRSNYKFVSREYCFLEGMGVLEGREVSAKWKRFLPSFSPFSRVVLYSRDKWFRVEDTIIMLNDITQRQRLRYSPCNRPRRPRRWMRSTATGSKGPRFRTYTSSGNKFNVCQ